MAAGLACLGEILLEPGKILACQADINTTGSAWLATLEMCYDGCVILLKNCVKIP